MTVSTITRLSTVLANRFKINALKLNKLWSSKKTGFVLTPKIRIMKHFDYEPDLLIYDPDSRTIGVIVAIQSSAEIVKASPLKEIVTRCVQQAAYFYYLLHDASMPNPINPKMRQTPSIELVLVLEEVQLEETGESLRQLARESDLLQVIGVGLICEPYDDTMLRRAFPWMLHCAKQWLKPENLSRPSSRKLAVSPTSERAESEISFDDLILEEIKLEQYRLPETLILKLQSASKIHLLHGANGTGKSTLAEAIELPMTGKVDRIESDSQEENQIFESPKTTSATHYYNVIRHRNAVGNPRVSFTFRTQSSHSGSTSRTSSSHSHTQLIWEMSPANIPEALCEDSMVAAAFRLDQRVMDELTHANDSRRALLFLKAFFPEEKRLFKDLEDAREKVQKAILEVEDLLYPGLGNLPKEDGSRLHALGKNLKDRFNWLIVSTVKIPSTEQLERCLPLPLTDLQELSLLEPDLLKALSQFLKTNKASLPEALGQIDSILDKLMEKINAGISALRGAEEGLGKMSSWRAVSANHAETDYGEALNQWLEACALADLSDRHYCLVLTQRLATQLGWQMETDINPAFLSGTVPAHTSTQLEKDKTDLQHRRDQLFDRLQHARNQNQNSSNSAPMESKPKPTLNNAQIGDLNQVGQWIGAVADNGNFGDLCQQALTQSIHLQAGNVTIGAEKWTEAPLEKIRRLLAACIALNTLRHKNWQGKSRLANVMTTISEYVELERQEQVIKATFISKITDSAEERDSGLDDAINELMALFTPARWAYKDIQLTHRQSGNGSQLGIGEAGDGGADASLRFNTSELNIFALSLFLLCSPRLANPLRLLVLDDPLQNMDELTVTALARGLAKFRTILPDGWRLLLLFHGQDDLERFRHHLPDSPVYRLPWMRPLSKNTGPAAPVEIKAEHQQCLLPLDLSSVIDALSSKSMKSKAKSKMNTTGNVS